MLLTNRLFERAPPSREAKSIYLFCEGVKREYQYFKYFVEMDSRINIKIYQLKDNEDNSPLGLLDIAKHCIFQSKENPQPRYRFQENDEVWLVIDLDKDKMDSRKPQIEELIKFCSENKNWFVAISNPCFEVWLYFHLFSEHAIFDGNSLCANWKSHLNTLIPGGFDSRKHPIYIQYATANAKANFKTKNNSPVTGSTEVFRLAENIISILATKLSKVIKGIEEI